MEWFVVAKDTSNEKYKQIRLTIIVNMRLN